MLLAEEEVHRRAGYLADLAMIRLVLEAHSDRAFRHGALTAARDRYRQEGLRGRIRHKGWEQVSITLRGGSVLHLETPYLRPSRRGLRGRPRINRGEAGAGCFPVLDVLGIKDGVTPAARSCVARQTVRCASYEEARQELERQHLTLDVSSLVRIAIRTGVEALSLRDAALTRARQAPLPLDSPVAGRRLRVAVDGGRARTRYTHRRGRRRRNGRHGFELLWREPRLITIDLLDEDGEMDRSWKPIYEVTLGEADEVFSILSGVLRLIGAHLAAEVVFVADGAPWIWDRVEALLKSAEIPRHRAHFVLDFYHACEHVTEAVRACKNLSPRRQQALCEELYHQLKEPDGARGVIERLRALARGRRGRQINKQVAYLGKRLGEMDYAGLRAKRLPIGSGVVESAIRRVVNLRFKSAGMSWRPDHLLPLLYLRAILKSGRWNDRVVALLNRHHWLPPTTVGMVPTPLLRAA